MDYLSVLEISGETFAIKFIHTYLIFFMLNVTFWLFVQVYIFVSGVQGSGLWVLNYRLTTWMWRNSYKYIKRGT